jgi:hypothetical protein
MRSTSFEIRENVINVICEDNFGQRKQEHGSCGKGVARFFIFAQVPAA